MWADASIIAAATTTTTTLWPFVGDYPVSQYQKDKPFWILLLIGCQEEHPDRKNPSDVVLAWLSSGAKCK